VLHLYQISPEALDDLQLIRDFIAVDSAKAAERVIDQFFEAFEQLAAWPKTGHVRIDLTSKTVRFWPVGSYLIVYRDHPDYLQIVAVLHGSRDVPSVLNAR
jgi:plasmid stabilization system protein ParE